MLIRTINDNELEESRRLCFTAFEKNIDQTPTPEESAKKIRLTPVSRIYQNYNSTLAAFDDENNMAACMSICLCSAAFDGTKVWMSQVGDVASLPCCQGKGVMKALFKQMLNQYYDQGVTFSYLYPFSGTYYNQYGYSYCVKNTIWKLNLSKLPSFPQSGHTELYCPERLEDVKEIYAAFTSHLNLAVLREDIDWHHVMGRFDPALHQIFTYIFYDENNRPQGYLTYQKMVDGNQTVMYCRDFAYVSAKGLKGLLNYCRSRSAYYDYVRICLPESTALDLILPEFNLPTSLPTSIRQQMAGMVRIIHPESAFRSARYEGSGHMTVWLMDHTLPQNTGLWDIQWKDGRCVSVHTDNNNMDKADMVLDISLFSRLLCRGLTTYDIPLLPDGSLRCTREQALAFFPSKAVGIFDHF